MSVTIEIGGDATFMFSAAHAGIHGSELEPLHGHSFTVTVRLTGSLDEAGMLIDFSEVKNGLKAVIDPLRRRTLMPAEPVAGTCRIEDGQVIVACGDKWYSLPKGDVALLPVPNTTTEAIAAHLLGQVLPHVRGSAVERVELVLAEASDTRAVVAVDREELLW